MSKLGIVLFCFVYIWSNGLVLVIFNRFSCISYGLKFAFDNSVIGHSRPLKRLNLFPLLSIYQSTSSMCSCLRNSLLVSLSY